jgi:hypothetical protein
LVAGWLRRLAVENCNAFTRTASAAEAIVTMQELASPVAAFVREKCELGKDYEIKRDDLYAAYRAWCEANGHSRPTKEVLGRDLRAAFASIRTSRPREGGERHWAYVGIRLASGDNIGRSPGPPGPEDGAEAGGPGGLGGPAMYSLHASDLGHCAQCDGPQADAPLITGDDYPPSGVFLHPGCRKPWLRRHETGGQGETLHLGCALQFFDGE